MNETKMLGNTKIKSSLRQVWNKFLKAITPGLQLLLSLTVYAGVFYFGLTCELLQRSPLLHFVGTGAAFVISLFTLGLTFCWGFISGIFELMGQSIQMFPVTHPQLRVVTGLVFTIGIIIRFLNLMAKESQRTHLLIPGLSGIALFFGASWLNDCQNLGLSMAEEIFIAIGYPVFYAFQKGRGFKIRRKNFDNE
jgi:hypothetical protein